MRFSMPNPLSFIRERDGQLADEFRFDAAVDVEVETALTAVEEKFEKSSGQEYNMPFHNRRHSQLVVDRVKSILEAIRSADPELVTHRDIKLGRLIAANHDTIQNWKKTEDGQTGKMMRTRFAGLNEEASFAELKVRMEEANKKSGSVFSAADFEVVQEAIMATVPSWDAQVGTVVQPGILEKDPSVITLSLALADIGSAGMNTEDFLIDGDALFREENLDILADMNNSDQISSDKKEANIKRMLNWSKSQTGFARGRQQKFEEEIKSLPEEAKEKVRELFSHFDESIETVSRVAAEREQKIASGELNFESLAKEMGY